MTDLKDRMGALRNDDKKSTRDKRSSSRKKGWLASPFSDILQEEEMAVINTFHGGEATFVSTRGTMTSIEYIAAPADMLARLRLCRALVRTGTRLQLVRRTQRHDHSLVIAVFLKRSVERKSKR